MMWLLVIFFLLTPFGARFVFGMVPIAFFGFLLVILLGLVLLGVIFIWKVAQIPIAGYCAFYIMMVLVYLGAFRAFYQKKYKLGWCLIWFSQIFVMAIVANLTKSRLALVWLVGFIISIYFIPKDLSETKKIEKGTVEKPAETDSTQIKPE